MKKTHKTLGTFTAASLALVGLFTPLGTAFANRPDFDKQQMLKYGNLPLRFEANMGQTDTEVKFISRGSGYTMFLTSDEAVLVLSKPVEADALPMMGENPHKAIEAMMDMDIPEPETAVLRMKLISAKTAPAVTGLRKLPGITNYFIGNDPQKWYTNVTSYAKVEYKEVYEGVDLVYYGNQRQLEYDFVVSPGTNPNVIKLDFEGAERLELDEDGDLVIHAGGGELRQHKPVIYQEIDGNREVVSGGYMLHGKRQVSFVVANYDPGRPLVIDPILSYSTYLGGSFYDYGYGIAVDGSGSAYVTGVTYSSDFPTADASQNFNGGSYDVFVTKLDASGSALVYSTYLGGSYYDYGYGIAVDGSGNAYVTGRTNSTNFPTANAFQSSHAGGWGDVFVTKLDASGSALSYSTYLGGSSSDISWGIAVEGSGSAYVTGYTWSSNFPTANALQSSNGGYTDVFVTKLNASGSALVYSTYLGDSSHDRSYSIAVDGLGNAYVTGRTNSTNFPTANALQGSKGGGYWDYDAFVTKFDASGSAIDYSTYLGGSDNDTGFDIAVDGSGNAYVTGRTNSTNFPTANAFQSSHAGGWGDGFVTKLDASGFTLNYSTYLGGSYDEWGSGIAVDGSGNTYITGRTYSYDFPTSNALQISNGGRWDAFVTKLNTSGSALDYSTYLGGSWNDIGFGVAVDGSGNAYVSGHTLSSNFPTANAFQSSHAGGLWDAFVTKLSSELTPEGAVELLTDDVRFLVDIGALNQGQGNALTSKLEAIIQKLNKGNINAAINQLGAFINQVNAFINGGVLTPEEGQPLIEAANNIIDQLQGSLPKRGITGDTVGEQALPKAYALEHNYPNPFNPETEIRFAIPDAEDVTLKVYNIMGQEVRALAQGRYEAGYHTIRWDGKDEKGIAVPSGMYLYRIQAGDFLQVRKMSLLR